MNAVADNPTTTAVLLLQAVFVVLAAAGVSFDAAGQAALTAALAAVVRFVDARRKHSEVSDSDRKLKETS